MHTPAHETGPFCTQGAVGEKSTNTGNVVVRGKSTPTGPATPFIGTLAALESIERKIWMVMHNYVMFIERKTRAARLSKNNYPYIHTVLDSQQRIQQTYRGGFAKTAASVLANHKPLIRATFVMGMYRIPQRLAGKSLVNTGTHLRVAVAAVALRIPIVEKGDTAAQTTRSKMNINVTLGVIRSRTTRRISAQAIECTRKIN